MFKCPICWFHKINTCFLLQLNQNLHEFFKLPRFTLANIFCFLFFFYVRYFRKLSVVILLYFLLYLGKSLYSVPLFLSFYTFFLFLRISPTSIPFFYNCSTSSSLYPHSSKCPNLSLSLLLPPFFLFFSGRMFLFFRKTFCYILLYFSVFSSKPSFSILSSSVSSVLYARTPTTRLLNIFILLLWSSLKSLSSIFLKIASWLC